MRSHPWMRAAICLLAVAAAANANAQLSTTGNGPYYAVPSWDQKLATGRFVVLANWNNEAVLDRETGLVWEKVPSTGLGIWFEAELRCGGLNLGGRMGWRVPSRAELQSVVDRSQLSPALPIGHPFTLSPSSSDFYWSATTVGDGLGTNASVVLFRNGESLGATKSLFGLAWCVRGGSGGDSR